MQAVGHSSSSAGGECGAATGDDNMMAWAPPRTREQSAIEDAILNIEQRGGSERSIDDARSVDLHHLSKCAESTARDIACSRLHVALAAEVILGCGGNPRMFRHCTAAPRFMREVPPLKLTRHTFRSSGVRPKAMRSSSKASKLSASAADAGGEPAAVAANVAVANAMYSSCSFE
jgi:hypothetical protein